MIAASCGINVIFIMPDTKGQFQSYTRQNMQRLAEQTAENLALQYEAEGGWTVDVLSYATYASKSFPDVSVQVLDARGNLIYDDPVGEDGDCRSMPCWALSARPRTGPM